MTLPDAFSLASMIITPAGGTASVPGGPLTAGSTQIQSWMGGVMTAWNPISYANTVLVGPVTYTNLPVVSPNGLTEGTVLLAQVPGGYVVMGMLADVGSTQLDPIRYRVLPADISVASSTTLVNAGVLNFLVNANTQYALDGCLFYNATTADIKFAWNGPANMICKWSMWGTQDTSLTHLLFDAVTSYGDSATQELYGWSHSAVMHPKAWFATTDSPGLLQLRFAQNTSNATPAIIQQGSWMRISELGSSGGAVTYTNQYNCTASRSYDHNGNPIGSPDQDNNIYIGSNSGRSFGQESSMWVFNGAQIRTDLTGGSLSSAKAWFYCFMASSSNSVAMNYYWSTASAVGATYPGGAFGGAVTPMPVSVPGWSFIDITAQVTNILNSGANSMLLKGTIGNYPGGFRAFGFDAVHEPYLQITFSR